jgi:hypothetical protein
MPALAVQTPRHQANSRDINSLNKNSRPKGTAVSDYFLPRRADFAGRSYAGGASAAGANFSDTPFMQ